MKSVRIYIAEDGTMFDNEGDCAAHDKLFKCPKCHGTKTVAVTYNAYPKGLPDSGWVEDLKTKHIKCDVCDGQGYTEKEIKPIYKLVGYE